MLDWEMKKKIMLYITLQTRALTWKQNNGDPKNILGEHGAVIHMLERFKGKSETTLRISFVILLN